MPSRDELHALLDQVPEPRLEAVRMMLEHNIRAHPPRQSPPGIERMRQRSQDYKSRVEQLFRETRKPGTLGTMGGGGFTSMHEDVPFGQYGFRYWDDKALINQTLHSFDGQELEIMERLSISPDRRQLFCVLELSSGGRTVRHKEEFPVSEAEAQP
jgi:hypothetical protein